MSSTDKRVQQRIHELVAQRPSDRRQRLYVRSLEDIERLRALTEAEREAFDAHLAQHMADAG